jgi:hypothetical protein
MLVMVIVPLAFVVIPVFAGNPAQGTTTTGQTLRIQIDEPVLGRDFVPGVPFTLTGETVIGALNAPARLLYVVDVSLSTEEPVNQDCNGDGQLNAGDNLNGNSLQGDTLDCEISGVIALNTSLAANTVVSAGIVAFAASAVVADVDPAAGSQSFTALNANKNTNALLDIDEVARSLTSERVGLFTARSVSSGTDFNGALAAMNQAFATQTTPRKIAYFLSDGDHNIGDFRTEPGSPLANAAQAGIIVNTYSVGGAATGCGVAEALRIIADTTGGVCSEVADPSELRTILPGTNPAGIARVEVSVGGATPITATLNALGRWSANITACSTGSEAIVATVVATDGTRVAADIQLCAPTVLEEEKEPTEASAAAPRLFLPMVAKE